MIRRFIAQRLSRSKKREHYAFLYQLAKDVIGGVIRFSAKDERLLLSYLDWLQRFELSHRVVLDDHPYSLLTTIQKTRRVLLVDTLRGILPRPVRAIYRAARRAFRLVEWLAHELAWRVREAQRAISLSVRSTARKAIRLPIVVLAMAAGWFLTTWRVRQMYFFGRKAAFDLLTRNGELEGAIEAFTQLSRLHSAPEPKYADLDRLMVRLLPRVAEIERDIIEAHLPARPMGEQRLLIGMVIWGDRYIDLFEKYCLASLLAEGNLPTLCREVAVHWHVITTPEGRARLESGEFGKRAGALCQIRYDEIPADLIELAGGDNRYWLYGALSNTTFRLAQRLEADIHFLNPDTVYSATYLSSLYRVAGEKGAQVVLSNSFRTTLETVAPALEMRKGLDGTLSLEAATLHRLGLQHIHRSSRAHFLNAAEVERDIVPRSTILFWPDGGDIVCHTAHHTPIFISHRLLHGGMKPRYFTIDSSILHILGGTVCVPKPEDGIGYFEISPAAMFEVDKTSLQRIVTLFWENNTTTELGLFRQELRLPVEGGAVPEELEIQNAAESAAAFEHILRGIEEAQPHVDPTKLASLDELKSYTLIDIVVRTDVLTGFEVRNGCIREIDTLLEEIRNVVRQGRIIFTGTQNEVDVIRRIWVNFLRLGLFEELLQLINKCNLPLDADVRAFTTYCAEMFPACVRKGHQYRSKHPHQDVFVMGCIVWGEEYIENFMRYNIRSMISPRNLPELRQQGRVVFSIVTDPAGEERIRRHPVFQDLATVADVEFFTVRNELIQILTSSHLAGDFYILYGTLDHCSILFAQGIDAHLFMIPVDAVVADGSLVNMANYRFEGYECCGGGNIVAASESFLPALDARFGGERAIVVATAELATLAAQHAHHYFQSQIVAAENKNFGKHPRELFWPVEGGVEIHSVFIHPLFTTASALGRYTRRHFANIDYGMIPRMFTDSSRIKIIENARDAYINNFASGRRLYETTGRPFTVEDFLRAHDYSYPVQKSLFQRPQFLPCRLRGWTPYRDATKDVEEVSAALGFPLDPERVQAVA